MKCKDCGKSGHEKCTIATMLMKSSIEENRESDHETNLRNGSRTIVQYEDLQSNILENIPENQVSSSSITGLSSINSHLISERVDNVALHQEDQGAEVKTHNKV